MLSRAIVLLMTISQPFQIVDSVALAPSGYGAGSWPGESPGGESGATPPGENPNGVNSNGGGEKTAPPDNQGYAAGPAPTTAPPTKAPFVTPPEFPEETTEPSQPTDPITEKPTTIGPGKDEPTEEPLPDTTTANDVGDITDSVINGNTDAAQADTTSLGPDYPDLLDDTTVATGPAGPSGPGTPGPATGYPVPPDRVQTTPIGPGRDETLEPETTLGTAEETPPPAPALTTSDYIDYGTYEGGVPGGPGGPAGPGGSGPNTTPAYEYPDEYPDYEFNKKQKRARKVVAKKKRARRRHFDDPIPISASALEFNTKVCRTVECNFGNLLADSAVEACLKKPNKEGMWTDVTIGLMNSGGIKNFHSEPWANLTLKHLRKALPYMEEPLTLITLRGNFLRDILEHSVSLVCEQNGRFLQVSGLKVLYDMSKRPGRRLVTVKAKCNRCKVPRYETVRGFKNYKVVMPKFLLNGGDNYRVIKRNAVKIEKVKFNCRQAVQNYLKHHSPLTMGVEDRLTYINGNEPKSVCKKKKQAAKRRRQVKRTKTNRQKTKQKTKGRRTHRKGRKGIKGRKGSKKHSHPKYQLRWARRKPKGQFKLVWARVRS